LLLGLGLCALVQACGFVEAAGEVTLGAGKIAKVAYELTWPKVDDLIGTSAIRQAGAASGQVSGLPTSLEAATLRHVQGLMTIDGECKRTFQQAKVIAQSGTLQNLQVSVVNCGNPKRCVAACKGFVGMKMEARVEFQLLDADKSKKINELMGGDANPDTIVQVRANFTKLGFWQKEGTTKKPVAPYFSEYELGVSSVGGGDDTVLVEQRYLASIAGDPPQRFELDPFASFTRKIKQNVLQGEQQWIEIFQRLSVEQKDLYSVRLGNAGVDLEFQPEFVISAIEVAKSQL